VIYLDIKHQDDYLLLRFIRNCNLNYSNTEEFKSEVMSNYTAGQTVIIDFDKLDFIDSAGLTVLIYIRKKILETRGKFIIINIGDKIRKLIQITRLHRVFEIQESLEAATKSPQKKIPQSEQAQQYDLQVQVTATNAYVKIKITQPDALIFANCEQFKEQIRQQMATTKNIIINFDVIRNIDNAGIAALVHLKRYSRQHHQKIILVYNNRVLNRLFKLYSLDSLFAQFQTDEEAIKAIVPAEVKPVVKPVAEPVKKAAVPIDVQTEFNDILFLSAWNK